MATLQLIHTPSILRSRSAGATRWPAYFSSFISTDLVLRITTPAPYGQPTRLKSGSPFFFALLAYINFNKDLRINMATNDQSERREIFKRLFGRSSPK